MRAVRSKDTDIEKKLRQALWKKGYRYRKNVSRIKGKPDIAFISLKIAIFCDSDFWHGYNWKLAKKNIKSNREFWHNKIEQNMKRDKDVNKYLRKSGWIVLRFWGHDIDKNLDKCVSKIEKVVKENR